MRGLRCGNKREGVSGCPLHHPPHSLRRKVPRCEAPAAVPCSVVHKDIKLPQGIARQSLNFCEVEQQKVCRIVTVRGRIWAPGDVDSGSVHRSGGALQYLGWLVEVADAWDVDSFRGGYVGQCRDVAVSLPMAVMPISGVPFGFKKPKRCVKKRSLSATARDS